MMVISFYLALWLTNFLYASLYYLHSPVWCILSLLPGLLSFAVYIYIVKSATLLRAIIFVDHDLMEETMEQVSNIIHFDFLNAATNVKMGIRHWYNAPSDLTSTPPEPVVMSITRGVVIKCTPIHRPNWFILGASEVGASAKFSSALGPLKLVFKPPNMSWYVSSSNTGGAK